MYLGFLYNRNGVGIENNLDVIIFSNCNYCDV